MAVPAWIWVSFAFTFGCCIGSFINVVIYRLPRDKSLVSPPSSCPSCSNRIRFYDNIPLVSWIVLGGRCRKCKASISIRYFVVELLVGVIFAGLYLIYFETSLRQGLGTFAGGGWLIYLVHISLLAAFVAASGIDLEHWVIPLSICWLVTIVGLAGSAAGGYVIDPRYIEKYGVLPMASPMSGALALGATIGLAVSLVLLITGVVKRSYEEQDSDLHIADGEGGAGQGGEKSPEPEVQFNDRLEVCREMVFLLPIIVGSMVAWWILKRPGAVSEWWAGCLQVPAISGLLGSIWGYFVGCAVVWGTRIFGTLLFGREAMGLGDVHLMGAAGTVIGPLYVVVAFFIAPFFGLGWAGCQMFIKKIRQIPYGPFLSLGVLTVMIFHDGIRDRLLFWFSR